MAKIKKSGRRKLGLFNSLILVINIIFAFALLLSYLSVHVSPEKSWILPFFGLLYPYILIINFFLLIYWIIRRRWLFLLSALTVVAGWNHMARTVQLCSSSIMHSNHETFKIISYNVKNLSNDNVDLNEPEIRNKILTYLDDADADIICLQEFSVFHPDPEAFIDSVSKRLNLPYHAHSQYTEIQRKRIDAVFIFSKFPITSFNLIKKDDIHNYGLFADLLIGQDTIRLFNTHLESLRLKHEDYNFISELDLQFEENENIKARTISILRKIKTAFSRRALQVDNLAAQIRNSPYPVILCGDFNDSPNSYTYQQLTHNLNDAFIESGSGLSNTYIGKLPSYRIDYILYSDHFISGDYKREMVRYSDHYPLSCSFGVRQKY